MIADKPTLIPDTTGCECAEPGFCPRYKKPMHGRLREICRGVNVDPGEAALYRGLWKTEAAGIVGQNQQPQEPYIRCPYLGEPVKDEAGENVKKICEPCGGQERQVFACNHPALAPQQTTISECEACPYRPRDTSKARAIILANRLSPGDVLVMSAAIYSLHRAHPGKFVTAVATTANALYEHNPDVISMEEAKSRKAENIEAHYPAINSSDQRGITFISAYCEFLEDVLGVRIPLATNRPMVYLSKQEKSWMDQVEEATGRKQKFWLVNAGRKNCFTTKHWGVENYQRVVDALRGRVTFVQIGEAGHHHPPLKNVVNLVGKTDQRQLVRLTWHADGVLCGVTFLQHLAAALEKPSVVVMGGREPVQWNSYPRQQLMHTVGMLPCCRSGGCWKSRVVPLGDGDDDKDKSLCESPTVGEEPIPKCMALITPDEVVKKILLLA